MKRYTPKTGLVYHEDMLQHRCIWDENHIEVPERLKRSYDKCVERGLIEKCIILKPRVATVEEICQYHGSKYVANFSKCKHLNENELNEIAGTFDDVYVCPESYHAAMLAAGSTIEAMSAVLENRCDNAFALVRPPGHHAMAEEANGFCLFNNVVIAAKNALHNYKLKRILIVDWDVHHGQGVQRAFYDDPRVLYVSIHRYENGLFWPFLRESDWDYVGVGKGDGFNVNIPLNKTDLGDSEYISIFLRVVVPMALEFNPQLILVSAGFDAAVGCPEGKMNVTPACYGHLTRMLMSVCPNVCVVLEGGYCLESLEESVAMTLRSLLGDPCPSISQLHQIDPCVFDVIANLTYLLQNRWSCFQKFHAFLNFVSTKTFSISLSNYIGQPVKMEIYPTRNKYLPRDKNELDETKKRIAAIVSSYKFKVAKEIVALGYDNSVQSHFDHCKDSLEGPYRLDAILKKLKRSDILKHCNVLSGRQATNDELRLVHDATYVTRVQSSSNDSFNGDHSDPTYVCDETFVSACYAVGVCLNVLDSVLSGDSQCGFALVRPPGHHASISKEAGFCIFNNVAIVAKYAQTKYDVKKILIVDWDVNFGDGTFEIFENDPSVMFISLHRLINHSKCRPENVGSGYNVNICWKPSATSITDKDYIFAFLNVVLPLAYSFSPNLILISCGFGTNEPNDSSIKVSPWCFSFMTYLLHSLANGQIILILEGGIDVEILKTSVLSCLKSLLGNVPNIDEHYSNQETSFEQLETLAETIRHVKQFWPSL